MAYKSLLLPAAHLMRWPFQILWFCNIAFTLIKRYTEVCYRVLQGFIVDLNKSNLLIKPNRISVNARLVASYTCLCLLLGSCQPHDLELCPSSSFASRITDAAMGQTWYTGNESVSRGYSTKYTHHRQIGEYQQVPIFIRNTFLACQKSANSPFV